MGMGMGLGTVFAIAFGAWKGVWLWGVCLGDGVGGKNGLGM